MRHSILVSSLPSGVSVNAMTMLTDLYPAWGSHNVVTQSMGPAGLVNSFAPIPAATGSIGLADLETLLGDFLLIGTEFAPQRPRVQFQSCPEETDGIKLEEIARIGCAAFTHLGLPNGKAIDAAIHLSIRMIGQERDVALSFGRK